MKHTRKKSNGIKRPILMLPFMLVAVVALVLVAFTPELWASDERHKTQKVELDDATIIVEVNATDQDAGFQIFFDGEGWKNISIYDPHWRQIFNVKTKGGVKKIGGGTELFLETAEPEFETLEELQELLDFLLPGTYKFFGRTVEGDWLWGEAELTHVIPAGPEITSPDEGAVVAEYTDGVVVSWDPVEDTLLPGEDFEPEIEGYQVIVDDEESGNSFDVTLPPLDGNNMVTISQEFFKVNTLYKFEVLAIEASGNQTITESWFCTGPDGPGEEDDPCPEPE